ncbi:hypothetical protein RSAG8_10313, partial [Rhizoctonia solani AG-8 WAC10335]
MSSLNVDTDHGRVKKKRSFLSRLGFGTLKPRSRSRSHSRSRSPSPLVCDPPLD